MFSFLMDENGGLDNTLYAQDHALQQPQADLSVWTLTIKSSIVSLGLFLPA